LYTFITFLIHAASLTYIFILELMILEFWRRVGSINCEADLRAIFSHISITS
jgi:hypothetical protein